MILTLFSLGIMTPIQLSINFNAKEKWIPKNEIANSISSYSQMRLIQLTHWPVIKKRLKNKYPMIESINLSFKSFPNIKVNILEKLPWVMIIDKNQTNLFSYDGTLLNPKLNDFELPNQSILIIKTSSPIMESNKIESKTLNTLQQVANNLERIPFLNLQQIILDQKNIQMIKNNGIKINLGTNTKLDEKFLMLKYYLGQYRKDLESIEFIDIQFPKRVIIK